MSLAEIQEEILPVGDIKSENLAPVPASPVLEQAEELYDDPSSPASTLKGDTIYVGADDDEIYNDDYDEAAQDQIADDTGSEISPTEVESTVPSLFKRPAEDDVERENMLSIAGKRSRNCEFTG